MDSSSSSSESYYDEEEEEKIIGLTKVQIEQFPKFKFGLNEKEKECTICMN